MTPSIKKLCIFGLSVWIGNMLQAKSSDEQMRWRALKLAEAGDNCLLNCQAKVDGSSYRRSEKKIEQIYKDKEKFDVVELVSFVLLGVQEFLFHATDNDYIDRLVILEKRALWFMSLFDPKLESSVHEDAYKQYIKWTEE